MGLILIVLAGVVTSLGEGISGGHSAYLITLACWGIDNHQRLHEDATLDTQKGHTHWHEYPLFPDLHHRYNH